MNRVLVGAIVLLIPWSEYIESNVSPPIQLPSSVVNMTTKWASVYSVENGCGMIIVWMTSGIHVSTYCNKKYVCGVLSMCVVYLACVWCTYVI